MSRTIKFMISGMLVLGAQSAMVCAADVEADVEG